MAKLAAAAEKDAISISQKGELFISAGLQAEDFISASFEPAWGAFRQRALRILMKAGQGAEASPTRRPLLAAIEALAADLSTVVAGQAEVLPAKGKSEQEAGEVREAGPVRRGRQVITDD